MVNAHPKIIGKTVCKQYGYGSVLHRGILRRNIQAVKAFLILKVRVEPRLSIRCADLKAEIARFARQSLLQLLPAGLPLLLIYKGKPGVFQIFPLHAVKVGRADNVAGHNAAIGCAVLVALAPHTTLLGKVHRAERKHHSSHRKQRRQAKGKEFDYRVGVKAFHMRPTPLSFSIL